jgi:hypothetical protein
MAAPGARATAPSARREVSPGPGEARANGATPTTDLTCVLCGHRPGPDGRDELRLLGAAPVVLAVCSDQHACVTRYTDGRGPS